MAAARSPPTLPLSWAGGLQTGCHGTRIQHQAREPAPACRPGIPGSGSTPLPGAVPSPGSERAICATITPLREIQSTGAQGQTALWGQQTGRKLLRGGVRSTGDLAGELQAAPGV